MGKVQHIKKSRKAYVCSKCRKEIPAGSEYFKGEINFGPTIIRCKECGLKHWEVTTSDYLLSVGPIANEWSEHYDATQDGVEEMVSELESIRDDLQDRLDNMPESLQYAPTGELLQERIDGLDSTIDELESIDFDDMKSEVISEMEDELRAELDISDEDEFDLTWDELPDKLEDTSGLECALGEKISDLIDDAVSNIVE